MATDAQEALARAPDEAAARRYLAAEKEAGRRDAAVDFLRALYLKTRHPGLWAAISGGFTAPELEGLGPPEATTIGPEKDVLLPRRPYRDVVLRSLTAPFATGGSIFMLVVSGPLMLGCTTALKLNGCLGLGISAFLYGYLCAFLFDILRQAAEGRERGPRVVGLIWFEGSRFEFVYHFARWLGAGFAVFWPLLLVLVATRGDLSTAAWAALGVGSLLLVAWHPIALIQASDGNGFSSFHYPAALDRVRRLGADYGICAAIFVLTNAAVVGVQLAAAAWSEQVEERQMVARIFVSWATFASWQIQMRAAGLLAWARADVH